MLRANLVSCLSFLLLSGCAVTRLSTSDMGSGLKLASKPGSCELQVFRTQKPAAGTYTELASLQVTGNLFAGEGALYGRLKRAACARGADAIIVVTDIDPGWSNSVRAVAIAFTGAS